MSKLGIITVRTKGKSRLCIFNKISVKDVDAGVSYMTAEIEIAEEKLGRMSRKKRCRLLCKAEMQLRRLGTDKVLIDSRYKELLLAEQKNSAYFLPPQFCFDTFELASERVRSGGRIRTLAIYDSKLRAVSISRLENVVMSVNSISLYTEKTDEAENLADRLLDKYGILIDVMPMPTQKSEMRPEYLIDVDNGRVCVGDFAVDGIELDTELGECRLDNADIADNIELFGSLNIKRLISGKNAVDVFEKCV